MQKNFEISLAQTLVYEGGYSNDLHDPGGATMNGVTWRVYNAYRKSKGRPVQSVKLMIPYERSEIYKAGYWDLVRGDELPSGVDMSLFDYAVNSGASRPNKTYRAIMPCAPADAIRRIAASRLSFLHGLSSWRYFGGGWGRRVGDVELKSLKLNASGGLPTITPSINDAKLRAAKKKAQSKITTTSAAAPAGTALHPAVVSSGSHWVLYAVAAAFVIIAVLMAIEAMHQNSRAQALAQG